MEFIAGLTVFCIYVILGIMIFAPVNKLFLMFYEKYNADKYSFIRIMEDMADDVGRRDVILFKYKAGYVTLFVLGIITALISCSADVVAGVMLAVLATVFVVAGYRLKIIHSYFYKCEVVYVDSSMDNVTKSVDDPVIYVIPEGFHLVENYIGRKGQNTMWHTGPKVMCTGSHGTQTVTTYQQRILDFSTIGIYGLTDVLPNGVYYIVGSYWSKGAGRSLYLFDYTTNEWITDFSQVEFDYEHFKQDSTGKGFYFRMNDTAKIVLKAKQGIKFGNLATSVNGLYYIKRYNTDCIFEASNDIEIYENDGTGRKVFPINNTYVLDPVKDYIAVEYGRNIGCETVAIKAGTNVRYTIEGRVWLKTRRYDNASEVFKYVSDMATGKLSLRDYICNELVEKFAREINNNKILVNAEEKLTVALGTYFNRLNHALVNRDITEYYAALNNAKTFIASVKSQYEANITTIVGNLVMDEEIFEIRMEVSNLNVNLSQLEQMIKPFAEAAAILPPLPTTNDMIRLMDTVKNVPLGMQKQVISQAAELLRNTPSLNGVAGNVNRAINNSIGNINI